MGYYINQYGINTYNALRSYHRRISLRWWLFRNPSIEFVIDPSKDWFQPDLVNRVPDPLKSKPRSKPIKVVKPISYVQLNLFDYDV